MIESRQSLLIDAVLNTAFRDGQSEGLSHVLDALGPNFPTDLGETLASRIVSMGIDEAAARTASALSGNPSPLATYVRARVLLYAGETDAALAAFSELAKRLPAPDANVLFHLSRLLLKKGRETESVASMRLALNQFPAYPFYVRAEQTVGKLSRTTAWQSKRTARVALVGSSTTALLAPILRAATFRNDVKIDLYEGLYGNFRQEILDPASGLYAFNPDFVVILVNHRDLALPQTGGKARADAFVTELRNLWETLLERHPCRIVQIGPDNPPQGSMGSLENTRADGRRRLMSAANLALSENLPRGVSYIDAEEVALEVGPEYFSDAEWNHAKQCPPSAALPRLAEHVAAHIRAALGLSAKALVLDLDNTLWGGVVGEDGVAGIKIGQGNAEAEAYLAIQTYAKELAARGIVLAVCSKNNRADAEVPFKERADMPLKLGDFAAFHANWEDKVSNIRAIAKELSLGTDSFVFLDDNPLERALVRQNLPEVVVPEFVGGPVEMLASLKRGLYFESLSLTREDLDRSAGYQANAARKSLETSSSSLEDFLRGLEMKAETGPVDDATLERVTQLVNKTNQFNLTTRRYTIDAVRAMAQSPEWWCRWFRLSDKFGDHGLIGVMFAKKSPLEWTVETWLMSCRVLGRRMEDFMTFTLLSAAKAEGATSTIGLFLPTEKNAIVKDLYPKMGFLPVVGQPGYFCFDLSAQSPKTCAFIKARG
jgi:FkbH-like protein